MYQDVIKVHRKGIIVLPKSVREALGIEEGSLLMLEVKGDRIVLKPLDLWERVWKCCIGSAEEAENELDLEEKEYWEKREI
ncbi:AbrB/MazE/SpoVT family DNA-binding domain-containing protein [Ignisphaera sp. 4213-co]|uniref:AbrB/MazE/SpoVT family DNA-binding domain-containing protein n=1 Tax=Ignisphaera cupida TaxID=3050454 RepID=A0ABD4Z4P1_9CREN|nr:AbrB/MazE/SpoVT family DNA-binding domain-containing protein [Ignisphaera sp. 4213-co]MDK6028169.1 AbrB/MazE/SpoVT family DNA-binding domain-containing protein [Ignisphaera sp. 4213-co]